MTEQFEDPLGRTLFPTRRPDGNIELEVAPGQHVCDFCLAPDPTWEYECGLVAIVGNANIHATEDKWAACDHCRKLIDAGNVPAMVSRMIANQTAAIRAAAVPDVDLPPRRVRAQHARANLLAFLRAKRSEAQPYSR